MSKHEAVCKETLNLVVRFHRNVKLGIHVVTNLWLAGAKYIRASPRYEPVPLAWLAVSSHPHSLFSPSTIGMAGGAEKE